MMCKCINVLVLSLLGLVGVSGQIVQDGQCSDNIQVQANFNIQQYLGKWHLIESYNSDHQQGTCNENIFSEGANGTITVFNTQVIDQELRTITGSAIVASNDGSGKLLVTFPSVDTPSELWILNTDYENYSLVYTCENINSVQRRVFSWKLSRTNSLSAAAVSAINATINSIDALDQLYYNQVDRSDAACYYFPEPDGRAVIFTGQCNQSISAVANFNASRYIGNWRLIESYYSDNQQGTCNENIFSEGANGTITVFNTQVIDQELRTITGSAVVASTDGSGKLLVTFPSSDTPTELWILDTDYDNYSLLYSCENINGIQRRVFSWKLSRTNSLSAAAVSAINATINSIDVLDDRYYNQVNRTDAACFYFPEPDGRTVVFRGQCDQSINTVTNFNASRYLGEWRLIESYYSDHQQGTCNTNTFSEGANGTITVFNTQVIDQELGTITGSAVVASTDGSGKLLVTFPSSDTPSELWILNTDYDSYSLVYSCENINSEQRRVFSWKLSRTNSLTAAAVSAINATVNSIDVLDERYYNQVNRTDAACFYIPEPDGRVVVFRGQCDPSINTVTNFNVTRYLGNWRLIESYYSDNQQGTCNTNTFSEGANGTITVYNTQVIDQELRTITGSAVVASTDGSGKLQVTFPSADTPSELWILSTDYDSYSLVYSCENINSEQRRVFSWKLSRTNTLSAAAVSAISTTINNIDVLDERYYNQVNRSDAACFYLPDVDGGPVIFRGQCDQSINTVANFNATRYLGNWRLIESYYSERQQGTCNENIFSEGVNGTITVFNTQVVDQELRTITGSAVVASTDGSGKLLVTFPSVATPSELWILDTDYENYSLAYSCENINSEQKRVFSWKLSRTNSLSAAAVSAMNATINSIDVLNERYYNQVNRTDAACFYFPEPDGSAVIFRGQCDQSINTVTSFNASRYLGNWRLIESYYSDNQQGTCNENIFSEGANETITVFNTQVIDQELRTITGSAVVSSTDGSGKLLVTFPSAVTPSELWILDTDYENYSLVYRCENINSEQRRVFSWKLSRTNSLTAAAVSAINATINSIDVLDERYYNQVNRTDAACFYFPEPDGRVVVFRGQCDPSINTVTNFNATRYLGNWRLIESYYSDNQQGTCNENIFSEGANGTITVYNTQVIDQELRTITGLAVVASTDGSGKLQVTFPSADTPSELWILSTDYDSYSLVYSCENINSEQRRVFSWKLSRTNTLSAAAVSAISTTINNIDVLDERYYNQVNRSDAACFYLPDVDGGPVIFRGQCDQSINTVANFNATRYLGNWRLIESYYSERQQGTCNENIFSEGVNGTITVFNTQVVDQELRTITGSAVVASTDGSGKLLVTFPSVATPSELWILDTDYENYSLAYSCENINSEQKRVFSWKLSRTNSLSAAAVSAMNATINSIDVLNERYYNQVNRTDAACFYFPEPDGDAVVFRGQCDQSINTVTSFNASRYLGNWRLIESYYSDNQQGTCNENIFSEGANGTITVFNTQVIDQELRTITGSAVVASTDGSGKLLVTFPSSDTPSELWILNTDYDSYSLVYSCENINSEHRRVFSWKLSRTNSLSAAAVSAINATINSIDVLDDRYYSQVNRTDAACFYFPEAYDSAVIFRGQCDQNINTVTNFNAARYLGNWLLIESYYSDHQQGTCNTNTFSEGANGTITVYNTQVIDQELRTITGSAVVASTDGSGKLLVTFPSAATPSELWILNTDYDNYSLVYSCENINSEQRRVFSWKLSRTNSLSAAAVSAINVTINSIDVLDQRYYNQVDRSDAACFFLPEIPDGSPVVFSGQCDTNINAVTNFNATRYLGNWRLIESYYSDNQQGTCNENIFSEGANGTITVFNTQVIDQELRTITGSAVVASTDGSGKLLVTFPSATTPTELWILDTDYDNYSLVYSCENINSAQQRVFSWKLSRTNSLSAAAVSAINATINSIDVLNERYYNQVNRTDAACFYFPEPDGGPVIFRGQCDQSISAVTNFNASRYLGDWRLVESYYSERQLGTCNENIFSEGANGTITVFNTQVIDQELRTITGSAVVASTDGSGKLQVTFPSVDTPSDYWILDTDYDNYSLVYSCENINSDQRRVFSWKLSRTNSLSAAAVSAINATINSIDVLDDRYYYQVNRSDAACFYFPEPDGSAVIFRGQCDQSINVVTGFDTSRFMGTWNYIESYPAPFVTGTCLSADYTLQSTAAFSIETTQVVGQELVLQNGTAVRETGDTSAKFSVTFDVNGRNLTSDYWVLSTDYDNYALVYSCQNLNEETRRVIGVKLSRALNLTAASQTAIANTINQVQVLGQEYFEDVGHSDQDCFVFPDNNGGDVVLSGQCIADNQVQAVTNFNSTAFTGTWHEIARFPSALQVGECSKNEYSVGSQNNVSITQMEVSNEFQTTNVIPGTLATDGRGVITAQSGGVPFNTFYILDTDYTEYALIYGCRNIDNATKQIYSWKLSRNSSGLSDAANNRLDEVVSNNVDLFENYYYYTNQSTTGACFHYPEFDELPSAIELVGPCDESIRGIPNFNVDAYLGRWMEVGRYPQPTQQGTCNRAYYTPGSDFSITNVEVRNQTRAQATGSAVLASNDGYGVLNVTIERGIGPVTTTLHVLATDYTSYALLYNCHNLDNGNRQVGSWKISRTPTLTPQAESIIDSVINQTQGLAQQYYQATSQSEEDCFYVPSVDVNAAPLFRGQCNTSVEGFAGFNAERFTGWWHEIERYPVDNNRGECISSQYQGSGSSYQVVDTVVANGIAQIDSGTVQVSANGRLTRTINGQVQDIWVLGTDYDNYALLYSCEQVNDEYMRVWSAKHSKVRELTASAQAAMAPIIAANRMLHPQFYQQVDQSDRACFYYPEVTGQQVILPGQCDDNIPVQQNFDVAAYAGTWYQIERYPQIHEDGPSTCIGAHYTLNEATGVVTVQNWEVINGQLSTIEGQATIASNDGSAKLSVVLPVVGSPTNATVTTSLYVLTTNYESYSLAYSCNNIDNFHRSVGAWKLSRERTMPVIGKLVMESYMTGREELHQPYFIEVTHDDDCPEPSSGTFLRSSIIVMMICALWQILS